MRVRAVLRDINILEMKPGSRERIMATVEKNLDRTVNLSSLLRVMGLKPEERLRLFELLEGSDIHVWLTRMGEQHIIYMSRNAIAPEFDLPGYQWQ